MAVLRGVERHGPYVFSPTGNKPFQNFSQDKRLLDQLSGVTNWRLHDLRRTCVSGMARLGVAPHVADKILNHQSGTISGVAAVYQRHDFLAERREALERWGAYVSELIGGTRIDLKIVA
jgi:integrase